VHEALRETLCNVKAAEQEAAKDLAYGCRVERGQLKELPIATEDSIGNQGVQVRMKIGFERAERLDRDDAAGADVGAAKPASPSRAT